MLFFFLSIVDDSSYIFVFCFLKEKLWANKCPTDYICVTYLRQYIFIHTHVSEYVLHDECMTHCFFVLFMHQNIFISPSLPSAIGYVERQSIKMQRHRNRAKDKRKLDTHKHIPMYIKKKLLFWKLKYFSSTYYVFLEHLKSLIASTAGNIPVG